MWRLDHQKKGLSQVTVTEDLWCVWTMLGIFICNLVCGYQGGTVTVKMLVAQLCLTLCDPMDRSSPGSSVCGVSRQEYWNELPFPSPGDLPHPGIVPPSPPSPALTV